MMGVFVQRSLVVAAVVIVCSCVTKTTAETIVPDTECFTNAIPEGKSLACQCRGNLTDLSGVSSNQWLAWPGHTNTSILRLTSVQRAMNGTNFTCVLQTATRNISRLNYTLQVAFGPFDDNITVIGPAVFITDGSREMNLTCSTIDAHPPPEIRWSGQSFACDSTPERDACVFTPRVPEDDGRGVACLAMNPVFPPLVTAQTYFVLNLTYPPVKPLEITTGTSAKVLRSGNTVSCVALGGKPFVSSITFNCSNPTLLDQDDIVSDTAVTSSVVVDTTLANADPMVCTCSAVWDPEPELYSNATESLLYLAYVAKINSFTVNSTAELAVMEEDHARVEFECDVTGWDDAIVTIRKQGQWRDLGVAENVTETNGTEVLENRKRHIHTVRAARCEDTGTFTCSAYSGFFDAITESVRLTVTCGPRLYNGSVNPPPLLTDDGFDLHLVANPLPQRVQYSYRINDTFSLTQDDRLLNVACRPHDVVKYIAVCSFRRGAMFRPSLVGMYSVSIANAFGVLQFTVNVNDADNHMTAAAAGLIAGLLSAFIIILIIAIVALGLREREGQNGRSKKLENSEEDVEAASGSGRDSLEESSDNDHEVRPSDLDQPQHSQQQQQHHQKAPPRQKHKQKRDQGRKSSTTFAEVVPRSSDVIFAVAEPKALKAEPSPYYSYGRGKAPRGCDSEYTDGEDEHPEAHINPAWEDDDDDEDAKGLAPYESGYMSIELSPGKKQHDRKSSSTGSEYMLETKRRTFITNIFLPQQKGGEGGGEERLSEGTASQRHGGSSGNLGPHGDEYAKVRKVKSGSRESGGSLKRGRETSTSADDNDYDNDSRCSYEGHGGYEASDLDDTEEEKTVSIDMEEEEDSSEANTDEEIPNDDVFKSGDEAKVVYIDAVSTSTPITPPRKSRSLKEKSPGEKAPSSKEHQTKTSDAKTAHLARPQDADKKAKPPAVAPKPKPAGSSSTTDKKHAETADDRKPKVVEAADRKPKLLETSSGRKPKPQEEAAADRKPKLHEAGDRKPKRQEPAEQEKEAAATPARVEGRRGKRNASGRAATTTPISAKGKADKAGSGSETATMQIRGFPPEEDNARNARTESIIQQQQQQHQKAAAGAPPQAKGDNDTNAGAVAEDGDPNPRPEPMRRKKKKLVRKTTQEPKDVEKGNILEAGDSGDDLSEPTL